MVNASTNEHKMSLLFQNTENFWEDTQNRREVYECFARDRGFDALTPSNWYPLVAEELRRYQVHIIHINNLRSRYDVEIGRR
jgi:hypothetical protein